MWETLNPHSHSWDQKSIRRAAAVGRTFSMKTSGPDDSLCCPISIGSQRNVQTILLYVMWIENKLLGFWKKQNAKLHFLCTDLVYKCLFWNCFLLYLHLIQKYLLVLMCGVVWKQDQINELIKNIKCQPIHCTDMQADDRQHKGWKTS